MDLNALKDVKVKETIKIEVQQQLPDKSAESDKSWRRGPIPAVIVIISLFVLLSVVLSKVFGSNEHQVGAVGSSAEFGDHMYTPGLTSLIEGTDSDIIKVIINVKNDGKDPINIISVSQFSLIDSFDRKYNPSNIDGESNLGPGLSTNITAKFTVPKDVWTSNTLKIAIRDDMFDFGGADYKYISLKSNSD